MKTLKRLLIGSTGPSGPLNTDTFQRAMLAYTNTPDHPVSRVSPPPPEIIFGRRIRDFIPAPPTQYLPHWTWRETLEAREDALRVRHMRAHERLSEHTRVLPPLVIGNCKRLQNLVGPHLTKWCRVVPVMNGHPRDQAKVYVHCRWPLIRGTDGHVEMSRGIDNVAVNSRWPLTMGVAQGRYYCSSGIVVEVRQFDQFVVRVDGSGSVTHLATENTFAYTHRTSPELH